MPAVHFPSPVVEPTPRLRRLVSPEAPCTTDPSAVEVAPSAAHGVPHPKGWPSTDPSHRITMESGEPRCSFCDCRASGRTARLPCDSAPAGWRQAEAEGRVW